MYSHLPFYVINVIIHAGFYLFFVFIPFQSKLRYGLKKTTLYLSLWLLLLIAFDVLFFELDAPFKKFSLPIIIVWLFATILIMLLLFQCSLLQLAYVLLLLFSFQKNFIYCARMLYARKLFPAIFPWFEQFNYLLFTILVTLFMAPFLWYLFQQLKKIINTEIDFMQWKFMLLLPLTYYLYCETSHFGGINIVNPGCRDFILLLLLNSFAYLSYIAGLNMLLKSYDTYQITSQIEVMSKQLEMQKGQYERLTESFKKTAMLRHDWRHHILLIKNYADSDDNEGLRRYLEDYFATLPVEEDLPLCSKNSVDIILRHYLSLAKAEDIETSVSIQIPEDFPASAHQLCIIFGNLMENAVEGCRRQTKGRRFLSIHANTSGAQMALIIQNSYSGEIHQQKGEFLSSKHEGLGIGISSVRNIAEKSGGSFQADCSNHTFKVSVLLCVP